MIKILNKANDLETAIIIATINKIYQRENIEEKNKLSNWFVYSRLDNKIRKSNNAIWKNSNFNY